MTGKGICYPITVHSHNSVDDRCSEVGSITDINCVHKSEFDAADMNMYFKKSKLVYTFIVTTRRSLCNQLKVMQHGLQM